MTLLLIFLLGAMLISFMCSILESVLMSTPISFITMKEDEGYRPAAKFRQYKTDIDRPIAAILSLNTIANTVGAAGVGRQATQLFGSEWFGLVSAITTLLILIFSEIIPKTIGTSYWKKLMGFTVSCLDVLIVLMYPLVLMIRALTRLLTPKEEEASVSREEVSAIANVGEEEGVIDEDENTIIQNVIRLDDVMASDAMTPRIVAKIAPESMKLAEFYKDESFDPHSRVPVYRESPDIITGYVLRLDVLENLAEDKFQMTLGDVRRDIPFYNEETPLSDVWEELVGKKEQISVIIDEYGSFQGILTLEDVIETIIGREIIDENDEVSDMQALARERWQQRKQRFKNIQ